MPEEFDIIETEEVTTTETEEVTALGDEPLKFAIAKQRATTARNLAYALVAVLAASVVAHYIMVSSFAVNGNAEAISSLSDIFQTWLPVISGLASSGVTFFFTREQ